MKTPYVLYNPNKQMYMGYLPVAAELLFYACSGFEIPTLPALTRDQNQSYADVLADVLYRFQIYLLELHDASARRSVALQLMAHPDQSTLASRVRIYVLCRSAHLTSEQSVDDVRAFTLRAAQSFPRGGSYRYGEPVALNAADLNTALFTSAEGIWPDLDVVELRKFEERQTWSGQRALHYVPHRLWADKRRDPWLGLIEGLASASQPAAVRIELSPVRLDQKSGLDLVAGAGRWFGVIAEDLDRRLSHGEQVRTDGMVTAESMRAGEVDAASSSAAHIAYVYRGRHVYEKLIANADRLFGTRVVLAARQVVPDSLIGAVRAALSSPAPDDTSGTLGWVRPDIVRPPAPELPQAVNNVTFMVQTRWARTDPNPAIGHMVDLRSIVTSEEATSLLHLPVFDQAGQTSALSTSDTPFVIPPESLNKSKFQPKQKKIRIGYLYQRQEYLQPAGDGTGGEPFYVTSNDLMMPSLLVGAPGSGKSNLAFSLLIQLWNQKIPFLVLDPSTGNEYRGLVNNPALKDDLIVYTAGDQDGLPLQFNPFSVPPGVTVRNHATRILAAFKAAFSMFDPVPAIYEGALERLYCDERYCGAGRAQSMEAKGSQEGSSPTLSDFARAIQDELNEKALTLYEGSKESIGVIRGACTIRVDAIGKKMGHILNTPANNYDFFQKLLKQPAAIEMGALGDSDNIALLMAFFISQLTGHIEYQSRQMALQGEEREHIMLIEEAHRLLAGGQTEGAGGKSSEDLNVLLAEVRKFGQGVMILDQRPSSLVGGVMDNAYVKIMMRLSDRVGFERLSDELNLNEAQQRYAHSRLKRGQAIVLDRDAGLPVLTQAEGINMKGLSKDAMMEKIRENARRLNLSPPKMVPYVAPPLPEKDKPAEKPAPAAVPSKSLDSAPAISKTETARDWLSAELERCVLEFMDKSRNTSVLYHAVRERLELKRPDVEGAKAAAAKALKDNPEELNRLVAAISEKAQWAMVSLIAEEMAAKEVQEAAVALRKNAPLPEVQPAAPAPAAPNLSVQATSKKEERAIWWLTPVMNRILLKMSRIVPDPENAPRLKASLEKYMLKQPPDVDEAYTAASVELKPAEPAVQAIMQLLQDKMTWIVMSMMAEKHGWEAARPLLIERLNSAARLGKSVQS